MEIGASTLPTDEPSKVNAALEGVSETATVWSALRETGAVHAFCGVPEVSRAHRHNSPPGYISIHAESITPMTKYETEEPDPEGRPLNEIVADASYDRDAKVAELGTYITVLFPLNERSDGGGGGGGGGTGAAVQVKDADVAALTVLSFLA